MAGGALAPAAERQNVSAHHHRGMRRDASTSPPAAARAWFAPVFSILLLHALSAHASPQQQIVCKVPKTHECLIWFNDFENNVDDVDNLDANSAIARICYISNLKHISSELKFIMVRPIVGDGPKRRMFCKTIRIMQISASDWSSVEKAFESSYRVRRDTSYSPRGRYRGQTQSQYLAIDRGSGKDEGKAEAQSAADSSRATVVGSSGMGQAQSQSMYDPSCEDCVGRSDIDAARSRKPGQSSIQDNIPESYGRTSNFPVIYDSPKSFQNRGNGIKVYRYNPNQKEGETPSSNYNGNFGQAEPNVALGGRQLGNEPRRNGNGGYDSRGPTGLGPNRDGTQSRPYDVDQSRPYDVDQSRPYDVDKSRPYDVDHSRPYDVDKSRPYDVDQSRPYDVDVGRPGGTNGGVGPNNMPGNNGIIENKREGTPIGRGGVVSSYEPSFNQDVSRTYPGSGTTLEDIGNLMAPDQNGMPNRDNFGHGVIPNGANIQHSGPGSHQNMPGSGGYQNVFPRGGTLLPNKNILSGKPGTIPVGSNWPSAGSFTGPDGVTYYCCTIGPNNVPQHFKIGETITPYVPGSQGSGDRFRPQGGGSQGPLTSYTPGLTGLPESSGQYTPGVRGNQESSRPYSPRVTSQGTPSTYLPGVSSGQGPVGPYNPTIEVDHGASRPYEPGVTGGHRPSGVYIPETGSGQRPTVLYTPGTNGRVPTGSYTPGIEGGLVPTGSYTPGIEDGRVSTGTYSPGLGGGQIPIDSYKPVMGGGQAPTGTYMPGIESKPGSTGSYVPGVGSQGPTGPFHPSVINEGAGESYRPEVGQGSRVSYGSGGGSLGSPGSVETYTPGGVSQGSYSPEGRPGSGLTFSPGSGVSYASDGRPILGESYGPDIVGPGGAYKPGTYYSGNPILSGTHKPGNSGLSGPFSPGDSTGSNGSYRPGVTQESGGPYGTGGRPESGGSYVPGGASGPGMIYGPGTGSGTSGSYRPGGSQGSDVSYRPLAGHGTDEFYVQGGPGSGGSYIPGGISGSGGLYGPGSGSGPGELYGPKAGSRGPDGTSGTNGMYGPGGASGPSVVYVPGTSGSTGPGGQGSTGPYSPGSGHVSTGSYSPVVGNQGLGRPYTPGNVDQGSSRPYVPGGNIGIETTGPYTPGAGSEKGSYVPGLVGPEISRPYEPGIGGPVASGTYKPGTGDAQGQDGLYVPNVVDQGTGGIGKFGTRGYDNNQMGQDGYNGVPENVIDPNSITDGDDSEAEASVSQAANGTVASASSRGGNDKGRAQTNVHGTYTGSGSFAAQAEITGENKAANSEVTGDKKGASSNAQGSGRNNKSQANVKLGSETGSVLTGSQSEGTLHSSNTQVQGSVKGGMADAQARGPGSTSSQAQIGFTPYKDGDKSHDTQKTPFVGGGVSSAQSSGRIGKTQSQLHGTFKYGITYNGAAQAGASLDKDAVFPDRLPFDKIDVFDKNNTNIDVDAETETPTLYLSTSTLTSKTEVAPTTDIPFETEFVTDTNKEPIDNSENINEPHSDSDHHKIDDSSLTPTRAPPVESRRSFQPTYNTNNADYEYSTDKDYNINNPAEDYDVDDGFGAEANEPTDAEQTYDVNTNYNEFSRVPEATHQSLNSPKRKGIEVRQTTAGNTQHIVLDSLDDQDAEITQRNSERPDESKVYQPGERVPGTGGYTIPIGFTGSVKSVASKDKTYVVGSKESPSQAQTVSLSPGSGKVKYKHPAYGRSINPKNLRSLSHDKPDDNNRYVSVSKSVTRSLDGENHIRKQYSHTYYTKSSSCGYFTFTCTMVSSAEGKKKVCKPKIPTNPDGTPMRC